MKRSILSALVVVAFLAITGSASAHVVTVAQGDLTCTGVTVSWDKFPGGPFDLTAVFQDQAGGKAVASPYVVAHLSGSTGTARIEAPAAVGVTFRKLLGTWTADGGGSVTVSATVKCCKPVTPPPPPIPTTTVTTPGQTVTTPGSTVTIPGATTGQTVTVTQTQTVTVPGATVTVTTPGLTTTVTTPGPTVTVTTPGPAGRTIVKHAKPRFVYRRGAIRVVCPKGYSGSYSFGKKGKITATCSAGQRVRGVGVTG